MNRLEPFRGAFWLPPRAAPADNVAPPYDIVGVEEHRLLLERSPYNVVRFTLGERPGEPGDFSAGAGALGRLVDEGIIGIDPEPRLYLYTVDFSMAGRSHSFAGVVGKIDLDRGRVLSHEQTMARVKEGRLAALTGTRANLGLVFLVCHARGELTALCRRSRGRLRVEVTVKPGETHRVYELEAAEPAANELLGELDFVIADGHHRFQTAQEFRRRNPLDTAGRHCMVVLGSLAPDSGLAILPTHRVLTFPDRAAAARWAREVIGGFSPAGSAAADLTLSFPGGEAGVPLRYDGAGESLVAYLHRRFIDGVGPEVSVRYAHDLAEDLRDVEAGRPVAAAALRAVTPQELLGTVTAGKVFPPKSTFFYPKLYSGLVMRLLDHDGSA